MITGLVICHGNLAFEFVNAVEKILGNTDSLYPFTNENLSPETLYNHLVSFLRKQEGDEVIIMADLRGGSCWTVAKMLSHEFPKIHVISGVNLPMLISFLTKRDTIPPDDLPAILEQDTHRGVRID